MKTKSRVMSLQASPISTRSHTPVLASRKMKKLNSREVINKLNQNVLKTRDLFDKQRPLCSYDGLLQPNMNIQVEDIEFLEKTASQNENLLNKIELDE